MRRRTWLRAAGWVGLAVVVPVGAGGGLLYARIGNSNAPTPPELSRAILELQRPPEAHEPRLAKIAPAILPESAMPADLHGSSAAGCLGRWLPAGLAVPMAVRPGPWCYEDGNSTNEDTRTGRTT